MSAEDVRIVREALYHGVDPGHPTPNFDALDRLEADFLTAAQQNTALSDEVLRLEARIAEQEDVIMGYRIQSSDLGDEARKWRHRAETAEARIAEVERERDDFRTSNGINQDALGVAQARVVELEGERLPLVSSRDGWKSRYEEERERVVELEGALRQYVACEEYFESPSYPDALATARAALATDEDKAWRELARKRMAERYERDTEPPATDEGIPGSGQKGC